MISSTRTGWLAALGGSALLVGLTAFAAAAQGSRTKTVDGGGVSVAVTYLQAKDQGTAFKVVLDTHSANLDQYTFESIAVLRDDTGKAYPLEAVESASGGGHHREAVLRFARVALGAKGLELLVRDVAGVQERLFRWSLTQ